MNTLTVLCSLALICAAFGQKREAGLKQREGVGKFTNTVDILYHVMCFYKYY